MTREEATQVLEKVFDSYDEFHENTEGEFGYEEMTAINMAIEALQADAEPTETSTLGEKHQLSHGRLIDADELKKHLDGAWEELNDDGERKGVRLARWYLISAPTVDSTIDVVRCKDCEYKRLYEYDEGEPKYYYCALEDRTNRNWSVDDTDFCSWGERREE